jgi:hypothetical protein
MPRGGARNRSGPPADPLSGRSDRRGFSLQALPAKGFTGRVPKFPLPSPSERELEVWKWAWRTPQACAWSQPGEVWRHRAVAMWVRVSVACEAPDASASLLAQVHRFADQVGLTTAGLAEMGWKIEPASGSASPVPASAPSTDEVAVKRERRLRGAG